MERALHRLLAALLLALLLASPASAGPWHATRGNTWGWQLMTPDERVEHQRRLRSFHDYAACKAYQAKHHAEMQQRARRAGLSLPDKPRGRACEQLRRRGRFR